MQLYIMIAFICLGKIALAYDVVEVTHMPVVPDQHLDEDTQAALKRSEPDYHCFVGVNEELSIWGERIYKYASSHTIAAPISPCDACTFDTFRAVSILSKEDAKIATYVEGEDDPSLADLFLFFKSMKISCTGCHMVDNSGAKVTGDINSVWTGGRAELIIKYENGCMNTTILFINATNINTDTVKVECKGDEAFRNICTETHKTGELDHMVQNGVELSLEKGYLERLSKNINDKFDILNDIFIRCC